MRATFLVALLGLGCAATASLRVTPNVVCSGRAARLTWESSRAGEITAEPAAAALGDVAESGARTVRPNVSTTYRLTVSPLTGKPEISEATVTVVSTPELPTKIGAGLDESAGCSPRSVWVTAQVPPAAWDPRLRVSAVSSDQRSFHVDHAGRSADVAPGSPSTAFQDLPIAGAWKLETPLRAGEVCGEESLPPSLSVDVTFVCADVAQ